MKINRCIEENTVQAERQVEEKTKTYRGAEGAFRVLFLGNSITVHGPAPQIGWAHNHGMAASCDENDYVHIVVRTLQERYPDLSYCVTNVGQWELNYWDENVLHSFAEAKAFHADLVIIRLGENVRPEHLREYDFSVAFSRFVRYFRGERSRVVCTNLFWEHEAVDVAIRNECDACGATFVDIADLGYADENKALGEYAHPGVAMHPNDRGMRAIAERILSAI